MNDRPRFYQMEPVCKEAEDMSFAERAARSAQLILRRLPDGTGSTQMAKMLLEVTPFTSTATWTQVSWCQRPALTRSNKATIKATLITALLRYDIRSTRQSIQDGRRILFGRKGKVLQSNQLQCYFETNGSIG